MTVAKILIEPLNGNAALLCNISTSRLTFEILFVICQALVSQDGEAVHWKSAPGGHRARDPLTLRAVREGAGM